MNESPDTYLGIPLERWKTNMVTHLRDERKRNELLQQRLDDANAVIAKMMANKMSEPARCETIDLNVKRAVDRLIDLALEATHGDKTAAGKLLGMHRESVGQHLKKREREVRMAV